MTFAPQKTLFGFLVIEYHRMGDAYNFSYENFVLEDLFFMLPVI